METEGTFSALDDGQSPLSAACNTLAATLLDKVSAPELKKLRDLRQAGWKCEELDGHFKEQRAVAAAPDEETQRAWYFKMKKAFRELNDFAGFIPSTGKFDFLDLGCCPGSFTSYILSTNTSAYGTGISLPVEQGGHQYTLERHLRPRFNMNWGDLTYYRLHASADYLRGRKLQVLPTYFANFDLVILDGHWLRIYLTPSLGDPETWDTHRLVISQIIIALRTVKTGGTIVMKLSHPERTTTAQLLYLLDMLSIDLRTYKPRVIHSNRGTFYAIAQGIGLGPKGGRREEYIHQFSALWYDIAYGGEETKGRWFTKEDLNFIVSYEELVEGYLGRLAELGHDPWGVQAATLERWFQHKGLSGS